MQIDDSCSSRVYIVDRGTCKAAVIKSPGKNSGGKTTSRVSFRSSNDDNGDTSDFIAVKKFSQARVARLNNMDKPKLGWFERKFFVLVKDGDTFYAVNKNSLKKRLNLDQQQSSDIFNSTSPQEALHRLANAVNQKARASLSGDGSSSPKNAEDIRSEGESSRKSQEVDDLEGESSSQDVTGQEENIQPEDKTNALEELGKIGPTEKELQEKWIATVNNIPSNPDAVLTFLDVDLDRLSRPLVRWIVNTDVGEGLTALHLAIQEERALSSKNAAVFQIPGRLIKMGADVDAKGGKEKQTALQLAVKDKNGLGVLALSKNADQGKEEGESSLITAIRLQQRGSVRELIKNETFKCEQNSKALFVAISRVPNADYTIIRALLDANWGGFKLDVNDKDEKNRTLFDLITEDLVTLVLLVLAGKINLSDKDALGKTVLDYAREKNKEEMIQFLNTEVSDKNGV